jgi:hypothetical protein
MAASAILFVDHVQGSCTSLPDVIWNFDYQGSGAYDGPAARELSRRYTSGLALLVSRSPGTDGVELHGRLKQVQPGTAGVRVTGFAAQATVRAATQGNIRQVMPGRSILAVRSRPSRRWPGGRDRAAQDWQGSPAVRTGALLGLLLSGPQGGGPEGPVRELRAAIRESGSRSSRTGADSVACAEGPRGGCVDSAGP